MVNSSCDDTSLLADTSAASVHPTLPGECGWILNGGILDGSSGSQRGTRSSRLCGTRPSDCTNRSIACTNGIARSPACRNANARTPRPIQDTGTGIAKCRTRSKSKADSRWGPVGSNAVRKSTNNNGAAATTSR